ncbi:GNAT family N-acetyltransferase [Pseudoalteromonas mariniglutinosa]|uniref:GNAT family N-acetyltransferase n=1 Tax=Pseudoalteromonas mariniglutinosa TaxID=206042 RepID=UPI003850E647
MLKKINLRTGNLADSQFILSLLNQASFLEHIGDKNVTTVKDAELYIQTTFINSHKQQGFGAYVITLDSGQAIGMAGLFQRYALAIPDIGFALLSEYQGQGYVTQALHRLFEMPEVKQFPSLAGITAEANFASQRVLTKHGFQAVGRIIINNDQSAVKLFWKRQ